MRTSWWRTTSASRSPCSATARSKFAPIVSPSSGVVPSPCEYDSTIPTSSAACEQPPAQQLLSRAQRPQEAERLGGDRARQAEALAQAGDRADLGGDDEQRVVDARGVRDHVDQLGPGAVVAAEDVAL